MQEIIDEFLSGIPVEMKNDIDRIAVESTLPNGQGVMMTLFMRFWRTSYISVQVHGNETVTRRKQVTLTFPVGDKKKAIDAWHQLRNNTELYREA